MLKLIQRRSTSLFNRYYSKHTTGPQGVNGRLPIPSNFYNYDTILTDSYTTSTHHHHHEQDPHHHSQHQNYTPPSSTAVSLTDPLLIYQNYVSRGVLKPDSNQLRAAVEFQKLYYRVKDYKPPIDLQFKIKQLVREIENKHQLMSSSSSSSKFKPSWYQPQISKTQDLIKVLTDEEQLTNFPSPHGLIINGEVGCGKSMLMDIFANSLPHDSKCRWHYSNFMLWIYNEIHLIYQRRVKSSKSGGSASAMNSLDNEFILFEIAQKMIQKNTVLLLDEFMLPDLAAAKIVKLLFTYFFRLGGVLVATSNRLPEDLYATDFRKKEFRSFLRVLEARCYSLDMNSENDYRDILMKDSSNSINYLVSKEDSNHQSNWENLLKNEIPNVNVLDSKNGSLDKITVYGRDLTIPWYNSGIVKFEFNEICAGLYGPGDYISLASNYHTFIIDNIPILKTSMKNEARRFITLLDALYESKCKVFLRMEISPDNLFFPEDILTKEEQDEANRIKVQDEEMFSKTQIALTAPYRPNVSYYDDESIVYTETENSNKPIMKNMDLSSTNFTDRKAFTGEDEKFAYKRAVSRIKEMTGSLHWRMEGKWTPVDQSMRPWEFKQSEQLSNCEKQYDDMLDLDNEYNFMTGRNFNNASMIKPDNDSTGLFAPVFNSMHFWSMGLWGKGNRLKDDFAKKWIRGNEL
ncbi:Lactation elevated protein 1 [Wickerhamomyces ciferrii]|uniref:Lactation elevated protein 1 n=1 Tax=Wickerhamomyces ciferrii (strain ATCC 14091 / BCRC 22168 / CBS 111 / JCM 3599 / NBRC 0793 / NRRL Y-1031 F-60-10) TaxID=1206466 RepID=K0KJF3_WICCF|nr:Lactation elevated protein 1 [Wickerhamomyces ciferrii]CCH42252.1 Lactation elevated protein 1 [Wickerhamomyces ciferrii]